MTISSPSDTTVPQAAALLLVGLYGVLLLLWLPLWGLALVISVPGVYALLFGSVYAMGRLLGEQRLRIKRPRCHV
jgi:hypothetical protein